MIFNYNGTLESKRELVKLLNATREKDGIINTLSVARMQCFHYGHKKLLDFHEEIGDKNILAIGSCQEERTIANPYNASQRIEMVRMVKGFDKRFSGKLSIIKLNDIGAVHPGQWKEYVLSKIENWSGNLPKINVYIGGSELDIIDNGFDKDDNILAISLDRLNSGIMSATDIRKSIINKNDVWRDHVPYVIQDYMLNNFPEELTIEYQVKQILS